MTRAWIQWKRLICLLSLLLVSVTVAQAQRRTFVASYGNDGNSCISQTTPCRTFQRGHDVVLAGGEVVALDSAGYGRITITKSVTLVGTGEHAALTAQSGQDAVTINAGASDVVVLRDLFIQGGGVGNHGINITIAGAVHIKRCEIERFAQNGIRLNFANTALFITHTTSRSNGGDGLLLNGNGTTARLTVEDSRFENNGGDGLDIDGIESSITRVVTSGNGNDGIEQSGGRMNVTWTTAAQNGSAGYNVGFDGEMAIEYSVARGNTFSGMIVASGTMRVSNSVSTNNGTGFNNTTGGTFLSRQNNTVAGNGTETSGTITSLTAQ